ncbi:hypothetical protein CFRA_08430 [Corynebacterium frankenforstense DSM 45800]|uniref:Uncharacterized protein n=1 Tax=Corynebacterium frankenforstense DSM 45800 TaxID=1437875 RepID=A0A1L7CTU1_9CORY|nr:hypothetical protein [Corynebacterium frankenforstense]APT89273.1 hypothetical protein CFRA_08430 [Corynebacterium frankenforstense DSM 45800]
MSLSLTVDLNTATLADLEALVAAARTAGVSTGASVTLDGDSQTLTVVADQPTSATGSARHAERPGDGENSREFPTLTADNIGGVGEAAVRSVIDILTGRQEPPRR